MPLSPLRLVLLPGMDGTGTLFRCFAQELAKRFIVTAVRYPCDQRLSYRDLVELVRSALPVTEPYVLIAESFSTPVAILCAARQDANLRGLILCAGFARSPAPQWLWPLATLLRPAFSLPLPEAVCSWLLLGSTYQKSLFTEVRSAVAGVRAGVLSQRLRTIAHCDVRRELGGTIVPILYIRGTEDRIVSMRSFEEIRRIRPDTLLVELEAPHLVLQRRPQESAEKVKIFVLQLTPGTRLAAE